MPVDSGRDKELSKYAISSCSTALRIVVDVTTLDGTTKSLSDNKKTINRNRKAVYRHMDNIRVCRNNYVFFHAEL